MKRRLFVTVGLSVAGLALVPAVPVLARASVRRTIVVRADRQWAGGPKGRCGGRKGSGTFSVAELLDRR